MSPIHRLGIALLVSLTVTALAQAHDDDDLRTTKPRIGIISDDVARQRLKLAGVENAEILHRESQRIVARGVVGGHLVTLLIDTLQGTVTDAAEPSRKLSGPGVAGPSVTTSASTGANSARPDSELVVNGARIADPELMRDAAKPSANPPLPK